MSDTQRARSGSDPTRALCLGVHRDYVCRHRGACCTAGWKIPVEQPTYDVLRVHFGEHLFDSGGATPEGAAAWLGTRSTGECVFFDVDRGRLCMVHRELGVETLPTACRQFPRVVLRDGRGIRISLSHFCPTAAELLLSSASDPAALEVVSAPAPLSLDGAADGLDAREALPPLLRPGMLMDLEAYDRWERRAIRVLAEGGDAAQAIERIAAATDRIQSWRPGSTPLAAIVDGEFDIAPAAGRDEDLDAVERRAAIAIASVPRGLTHPAPVAGFGRAWREAAPWWPQTERVVRRYLAARLFGNWVAYHGLGLHAVVEYLRVCLAVLEMEVARQQADRSSASPWQIVTKAIRNADLLLVHLSDPTDLARRLS